MNTLLKYTFNGQTGRPEVRPFNHLAIKKKKIKKLEFFNRGVAGMAGVANLVFIFIYYYLSV